MLGRLEQVKSARVVTSVIVAGELHYGAAISLRKDENQSAVQHFLRALDLLPISPAVADEYGRLKAALLDRFGPRERARRRNFDLAALGLADNDLWIAASAIERRATLVSTDLDFHRIAEVSDLNVEDWTR